MQSEVQLRLAMDRLRQARARAGGVVSGAAGGAVLAKRWAFLMGKLRGISGGGGGGGGGNGGARGSGGR